VSIMEMMRRSVQSATLVDEQGNFRYLVVDLGLWIFGKKVLLPVGRARFDYNPSHVVGMTKEQASAILTRSHGLLRL